MLDLNVSTKFSLSLTRIVLEEYVLIKLVEERKKLSNLKSE